MLTTTDPTLEALFAEVRMVQRLLARAGLDAPTRDALGLWLLQPLVSDTLHELEQLTGCRLDRLYRALKAAPLQTLDVLSRVSLVLFVGALLRYQEATRPDQRTRWRVRLVLDDTLLLHSWASQQAGLKLLWDVGAKAYRLAHQFVVFSVVIGDEHHAFPLLLYLVDPIPPGATKVTQAVQALYPLQEDLDRWGLSLDGLDLVADHWYLKPAVVEAAQQLGLIFTTKLASNERVQLADGTALSLNQLLYQLVRHAPHHDPRLDTRGDYWRVPITHPLLGPVLLIVRRRAIRQGQYYTYDFLVTTARTAKAITVIRLLQRRWTIDVFFRESKQQLGLGLCYFHDVATIQLLGRLRAVTYLILERYRRTRRVPRRQRTIGQLKQRFRDPLLAYFAQAA